MSTVNFTPISDGSTADAADVNTPLQTIYDEFNGNIDNANIASGAAISGSKIADASIDLGAKGSVFDGWIPVSDSWAYASSTTITVPSDATTKYKAGDKIKLVQSATTKYFDVVSVASTVLTVRGVTTETVANSAISDIYYSKVETPQGYTPTPFWQEIGRTRLTGAGDTITVSSLPARRHLRIIVALLATGGTISAALTFNGDTGSNYSIQASTDFGAGGDGTSAANASMLGAAAAEDSYLTIDVLNIATTQKLFMSLNIQSGGASATTAPDSRTVYGKWSNTSDAISSLTLTNAGTGDFAIGSEVVVLGHD